MLFLNHVQLTDQSSLLLIFYVKEDMLTEDFVMYLPNEHYEWLS